MVAMLTGHCVMARHTKELGSHLRTSAGDANSQTVVHFLCQCPPLASCRYRLFGSPFPVSLTKLSSIDIKDIASLIKLSGWFSGEGKSG